MQELTQKFIDYINEKKLFTKGDKLLLAFSGGADSVCLAEFLLRGGYDFSLVHINFQLRASASDNDQQFCEQYAEKNNLKIHICKFDTLEFAKQNKFSIEEAARELRYDKFRELAKEQNYSRILTAHHADDNIETLLINFTAGTGIRGIAGIQPLNGIIARPLLFASKQMLLNYCETNNIQFCTDQSNNDERFIRNKIRHKILPVLRELNPSLTDTSVRNFENFSEAKIIYNNAVEAIKKDVCKKTAEAELLIDIQKLSAIETPKTILYEILYPYGFSVSTIKDVYQSIKAESGRVFHSKKYTLLRDRKKFELRLKTQSEQEVILLKSVDCEELGKLPFSLEVLSKSQVSYNKGNSKTVFVDLEKLKFPLIYRSVKNGDKFRPLGMRGKKLLSKYFIDNKFSYFQKQEARVLCDSNDDIIYLIGSRLSDDYKITETTSKVLKITLD